MTTSTDLAREALTHLAAEHLPPTPENYAQAYYRVAEQKGAVSGISNKMEKVPDAMVRAAFSDALLEQARKLEDFLEKKPLMQMLKTFAFALKGKSWADFKKACESYLHPALLSAQESSKFDWLSLIQRLINMYFFPHQSMTPALKRDQFEQAVSSKDTAVTYRFLTRLLNEWEEEARLIEAGDFEALGHSTGEFSRTVTSAIREMFGDTLKTVAVGYGPNVVKIKEWADRLAYMIAVADSLEACDIIGKDLRDFLFKAELHSIDQLEIEEGLSILLDTMLDGFEALLADDEKLRVRLSEARSALEKPMTFMRLNAADRALTAIIIALVSAQEKTEAAQQDLKDALFKFLDTFSAVADMTDQYNKRMDRFANKLSDTQDPAKMSAIFSDILQETNLAAAQFSTVGLDISSASQSVKEKEAHLTQIEKEAAQNIETVLESTQQSESILGQYEVDDKVYAKIRRAIRKRQKISIATLDINDFYTFIEKFGHKAGDEVMNTFLATIKTYLRKEDMVTHYKGEGVLLVFPNTALAEACELTESLQRALTKQFFLDDDGRVLITFNAGVTELSGNNVNEDVIDNAIHAMKEARKQGQNKVAAADASFRLLDEVVDIPEKQ